MQASLKASQDHYNEQTSLLDEVLNNAENRMYKTAEEFRNALLSIDLDMPIDEMVSKYWEYFTQTSEIFINASLESTKAILEAQSKAFENIGNTVGQSYTDGLLANIDKIMSGEGDIMSKQKAIIDMLAGEYAQFALAGNTDGMAFVQGLIDSMGTIDYELEFNSLGDGIRTALVNQSTKNG